GRDHRAHPRTGRVGGRPASLQHQPALPHAATFARSLAHEDRRARDLQRARGDLSQQPCRRAVRQGAQHGRHGGKRRASRFRDRPGVRRDARLRRERRLPGCPPKRHRSTAIPIVLIAYFARNVDWSPAFATLRRADPLFLVAALVVYYLSFPVRAIRWARLLREGGARIFGRDLLEILLLGWFVNCLVPAKLGDLYRSYLVKRRFGISLSRTVGVVVAERLLDLFVVFGLLIVDGYVALGRTILPDLNVLYVTGGALGVVILLGLIGLYSIGPRLGRFFPED